MADQLDSSCVSLMLGDNQKYTRQKQLSQDELFYLFNAIGHAEKAPEFYLWGFLF
jgi:hypothetical protein